MKPFRIVLFLLLGMVCLASFTGFSYWYKGFHSTHEVAKISTAPSASAPAWLLKMQQRAIAAKKYTQQKKFNSSICFLIDMNIESGKNRFFIYDLAKDKVLDAALVTHGYCNGGMKYSDEVGSGCTSTGRYKIGNPYQGRFGLAYKLYGLDSTNANAYARFVVLHSMECVPQNEVDPYPICQSLGCPAVSPEFLKKLADIIDHSSRPVLLWIYN